MLKHILNKTLSFCCKNLKFVTFFLSKIVSVKGKLYYSSFSKLSHQKTGPKRQQLVISDRFSLITTFLHIRILLYKSNTNKCIDLTSLHIYRCPWMALLLLSTENISFLYESVIFGITTSSSLEWFRKLWNLKWPPWERGNSII